MNHSDLIKNIYQSGAVIFEDHILMNGDSIPVYIDFRKTLGTPNIYRLIVDALWAKIKELKFDYICGLPYGAIPLASMLSIKYNIPMVLLRKIPKNYGTCKLLDGKVKMGEKILLIDDFISSGYTMLSALKVLKELNIECFDVAVLIDSKVGGSALIRSNDINVHSVMTLQDFYISLSKVSPLSLDESLRVKKIIESTLA